MPDSRLKLTIDAVRQRYSALEIFSIYRISTTKSKTTMLASVLEKIFLEGIV